MLKTLRTALMTAAAAFAAFGAAQAQPAIPSFDLETAQSWAEKLAICDTTAFLATRPDLNANRIWVRRDDGHRDLLLPPTFVGAGRWYNDDYQRLYFRLRRQNQVTSAQMFEAQKTLATDFVEAYRDNWTNSHARFLRRQDAACRAMARANGVIIS